MLNDGAEPALISAMVSVVVPTPALVSAMVSVVVPLVISPHRGSPHYSLPAVPGKEELLATADRLVV